MTMPHHLILIRHGESEGNVAGAAAKQGDLSHFTDEYVTTPGRRWQLTATGRAQAQATGAWLRELLADTRAFGPVGRHYVSPYDRTRQTAGHLGLVDDSGRPAEWFLNRTLRERDWGDIETIPIGEFLESELYANNARRREIDPLYWRPPGGESICDVAENRVRNFLDTLHREMGDRTVVAVSHGEFIRATRITLERTDDATYVAWETDPVQRIHNCEVFHYTRIVPPGTWPGVTGPVLSRIGFLRRARPLEVDSGWQMQVGEWMRLPYSTLSNEDLCQANTAADG